MTSYAVLVLAFVLVTGDLLEPSWLTAMRYCDTVVRGTVQSVRTDLEPRQEAMPMIPGGRPDALVEMTKVHLVGVEVLRGTPLRNPTSFVVLGTSAYSKNYAVGQEIVVGLIWGQDVLGGNYWLFADEARFVRSESQWIGQSEAAIVEDISEMKQRLWSVAPEQVVEESEIAATGVVEDVKVETIYDKQGSDAVQMSIRLTDVVTLGGPELPGPVVVKQIMSGAFWPEWRDAAPFREMPDVGKRYCFLLRRIDEGYALVRGVNGIYEVRGDNLYFAGRTPINLTTTRVRQAKERQ